MQEFYTESNLSTVGSLLVIGPETHPLINELSASQIERRTLDLEWSPESHIEEFEEWVRGNQSEDDAFQVRFNLSQIEGKARTDIEAGKHDTETVRQFNALCGRLYLLETEARLVADLKAWLLGLVDAPNWSHPSTVLLWSRFLAHEDRSWPLRRATCTRLGLLHEGVAVDAA